MLPSFSYIRPRSLDEAIRYYSQDGARVCAGGTDLLGCLREGVFKPSTVVSLYRLGELRGISETPKGELRIGALVTIADIARNPIIKAKYATLSMAASEVASPQLRNQGTIGGNLCQKPRCWYYRGDFNCLRKGGPNCYAAEGENQFHCIFGSDDQCFIVHPSDTAPALAALNARVHIAGPQGERYVSVESFHVLPVEDVQRETILEPGEIVIDVLLPAPPAGLRSTYRKVRARRSWDFALAGLALALQFDGRRVINGRVVASGAAPIPWRSRAVEGVIRGRVIDDRLIAAAADAFVEGAEPLLKNQYKIPLFRGVIEEELSALAALG
jgi:xanthine dehydrogenase YagS FAD-binding subunit